jgi:hypothetical protein
MDLWWPDAHSALTVYVYMLTDLQSRLQRLISWDSRVDSGGSQSLTCGLAATATSTNLHFKWMIAHHQLGGKYTGLQKDLCLHWQSAMTCEWGALVCWRLTGTLLSLEFKTKRDGVKKERSRKDDGNVCDIQGQVPGNKCDIGLT